MHLGYAYIASAIVTFYASAFVSSLFGGLLAVAVLLVISAVIEALRDPKGKEWLRKCYFGAKAYGSLAAELAAFEEAILDYKAPKV